MNLDQAGIELERAPEMDQRLLRSTLCHQRIGEIVVHPGEVGLERERAPIVVDRLLQAAERPERVRQVVVGLGGRLEPDHALVGGDGIAVAAEIPEQVAEVGVGLDVVRLEPDGLAVMARRLLQAADRLQGVCHVVAAVGNAIVDRDRTCELLDRGVRLTPLQGHDAEMMQAAEMAVVGREHLPVEALGLRQLSSLVMLHGEREQLRSIARRSASSRRPGRGTLPGGTPLLAVHRSAGPHHRCLRRSAAAACAVRLRLKGETKRPSLSIR